MQESDIFRVARNLSGPARSNFLAEACAENAILRSDVEALLEVYQRQQGSGSTHHLGTHAADTQMVPPNALFAERYRLRELIGQGGIGLVYLADQLEPIHRQVTIKIIHTKIATPSIINRFEQERQALVLMDHPSIAKVHDAGMASFHRNNC